MLHPTLTIALKAARNAGDIILRSLEFLDRITFTTKGVNDYVSEVDRLAEKEIISVIRHSFPHHAILAEETGHHAGDDHVWIIDPLDGTTNFMHGIPHFCVSIALQYKGRIEHGLVYDPVRQEVFSASRGHGAQLNEKRMRVSKVAALNAALLSTGFPYQQYDLLAPYMKIFQELLPICAGLRRAGSAALDLAYVAAGRHDGFWEFNLKPWDIAAGALLIKEACGLVGDIYGGENYLETGHIVAGNPKLFKQLLQVIKPVVSP
ncbi:MAG: inositol monophosphatase [Gammaproteobacteria bacterium]|nr:inositol monophosphatase [Gammaproteobacteria bacterium]